MTARNWVSLRFVWLLAVFQPQLAHADFGAYLSHETEGQSVVVQTTSGQLFLTARNELAFEAHYVEPHIKQLPSFALDRESEPVNIRVEQDANALRISTGPFQAVISKTNTTVAYFLNGEKIVQEEHGYFAHDTMRGFRFALSEGEKILGGGQRVVGMDRRGQRLPLYNQPHYGYSTESDQMYYGLPAVLSSYKYMIAFDNSAKGWLDIGHSQKDVLQFEAVGGRTSYLVAVADDFPRLIEAFTGATGRQPLPPRWAFGNFASRFGYRTEAETRDVVQRFRDANIPLDVLVLDLYWFGPDIKGHMGRLDWDRTAFPTPKKMISDFEDQGVKTIVITEPFILRQSTRWSDAVDNKALALDITGKPKLFNFYFGETGLIDLFNEQARDWFWAPYKMLFEQGVAGTWGDLGEPERHPSDTIHWLSDSNVSVTADEIHNVYGHRWAQMVYERQVKAYPEKRAFIMMRSGFIGTQRYGIVPWTGDVERSWQGLKPQVELSLQMGLFGLGLNHSDLGGFAEGDQFDPELYVRWLQYGVFQPIFRPHGQDHIPSEPVFHDAETQRLSKAAIDLRYRLLPYVYTLAWQNATTGMPLMRPLFFEEDSASDLYDIATSYLWGDAFLVTPITDPDTQSVSVNLPGGVWFDFDNDTRYESGAVSKSVTMDSIPVFVRAGSFIPMTDVVATTDKYDSRRLTLHYYADPTISDSNGVMFEDDGMNPNSLDTGEFELLEFSARAQNQTLGISLDRSGKNYPGMPAKRDLELVIHNWKTEPSRITVNQSSLDPQSTDFDRERGILKLRFTWDHSKTEVLVGE